MNRVFDILQKKTNAKLKEIDEEMSAIKQVLESYPDENLDKADRFEELLKTKEKLTAVMYTASIYLTFIEEEFFK